MNTYLYREKKIKNLFSKKINPIRSLAGKKSRLMQQNHQRHFRNCTKSRASQEVTSRWPVSSGQPSPRVDLSLLGSEDQSRTQSLQAFWSAGQRRDKNEFDPRGQNCNNLINYDISVLLFQFALSIPLAQKALSMDWEMLQETE